MGRISIAEGTSYTHVPSGDKWVVTQALMDNHFQVENQTQGGRLRVTLLDLVMAWGRDEIEFYGVYGPNAGVAFGESVATDYIFADFSCIDEKYREAAWYRYQQIRPLLALTPAQRGQEIERERQSRPTVIDEDGRRVRHARVVVMKKDGKARANSPRSKQRWLHAFVESGFDIRSLSPAVTHRKNDPHGSDDGTRGPTIATLGQPEDKPVRELLDPILSMQTLKALPTTIVWLREDLLRQITASNTVRVRDGLPPLAIPSAKTIGRYVREKELAYILRPRPSDVAAHGDITAVMPGPRPDRILARIEEDQSPLDLIVVDDRDRLPIGRPTLSIGIDGKSKYPFGSHTGFEGYSYQSIRYGLLDGIIPEEDPFMYEGVAYPNLSFGIPRVVAIDNGKPYRGKSMADAMLLLGSILDECHVKSPWEKGGVERFIRTSQDVVHTLPGTTFSSLMALRQTDYNPLKDACITLSAFRRIIHIFLYGVYARRPHRGLGGRTPESVWKEGVQLHQPDLTHRVADVRIWLLATAARTIQSTGIEIHCLRYQSPKLTPLRQNQPKGTNFTIKYDEEDLSHIYVLDPTRSEPRRRGNWLAVPAVDLEYTRGLSLYKHNIILDYAKRMTQKDNVDEYDLAVAEHHIRQIVEQELRLTGQAKRTRVTAARLAGRVAPPPRYSLCARSRLPRRRR